jgi:TPR repeat protein
VYDAGAGVAHDEQTGAIWFGRAAQQGHLPARFRSTKDPQPIAALAIPPQHALQRGLGQSDSPLARLLAAIEKRVQAKRAAHGCARAP